MKNRIFTFGFRGLFLTLIFLIPTGNTAMPSTLLPAPVLIKPVNGGTTSSRTPVFDWSDVPGAIQYEWQLDTRNDFNAPLGQAVLTLSDYTPGERLSAGTYFWRVRALSASDSSLWTSPSCFTIYTPKPIQFSPTNGGQITNRIPPFDWSDVSDATGYDFQLSQFSDLSSPLVNVSTVVSAYMPPTDLRVGTYYWRVRTQIDDDRSDWTPIWYFTLIIPAPNLLSPFNNSQTTNRTPTFDWSDTPGATSYDFQLSQTSNFSSLLYNLSLGGSSYALSSSLALGTYYWRVRAWVGSDSSAWSTVFSFSIITIAPTLWFPANGSKAGDRTPRFDWSAPPGAESYDLQVATDSNFGNLVIDLTTIESEFTPTTELDLGTYYWHVRIHSPGDSCSWSNTFYFTIIAAPEVVSFLINNGAEVTTTQTVVLNHSLNGSATHYQASEDPSFNGATWLIYNSAPSFTLSAGSGIKTVYFKVKNEAGESNVMQDQINYRPETRVGDNDAADPPPSFALLQCYPNPFSKVTSIVFRGKAKIGVYDMLGRQQSILVNAASDARKQTFIWDGSDQNGHRLAGGVYFLIPEGNPAAALKVVILR